MSNAVEQWHMNFLRIFKRPKLAEFCRPLWANLTSRNHSGNGYGKMAEHNESTAQNTVKFKHKENCKLLEWHRWRIESDEKIKRERWPW